MLATELPLELFEDMDEEVDRNVLHAEAAMRQKDIASMPTVAELAAPTGGAEWRNSRFNGLGTKVGKAVRSGGEREGEGAGAGEGEGGDDQDQMDEELARELARNRRNQAQEISERYDFNIAQAVQKTAMRARSNATGTRKTFSHGEAIRPLNQRMKRMKRMTECDSMKVNNERM